MLGLVTLMTFQGHSCTEKMELKIIVQLSSNLFDCFRYGHDYEHNASVNFIILLGKTIGTFCAFAEP